MNQWPQRNFHVVNGKVFCLQHEFVKHIEDCKKDWANPDGRRYVMKCKNCGKRSET